MKEPIRDLEDRIAPHLGGEEAPAGWAGAIGLYLNLLRAWNERVNLVSRTAIDRVVEEQLIPSLAVLKVVPPGVRVRALDVGSGGGFPGLPLAIFRREAQVDLVDARRKKCRFLEAAIREIGLERVAAHWCRIERPTEALRARGPFDYAFARAVGEPEKLAAAVRPLLGPVGSFWVFAAPDTPGVVPWPPGAPRTALLRVLPRSGGTMTPGEAGHSGRLSPGGEAR